MSEDQRDHSNKRSRLLHTVLDEVSHAVAPALKKHKKNHHAFATAASSRLLAATNRRVLAAFAAVRSFFGDTAAGRNNAVVLGTCTFDNQAPELYQRVLSFLHFADRQTLTLCNKRAKDQVEEYSKKVYEKIKKQHDVDETFEARVCDQSDLLTTTTGRAKPVPIPYRYRLSAALRKHLYKMEMIHRREIGYTLLRLSPSEHRLAMLTAGETQTTWDLSTQSLAHEYSVRCDDDDDYDDCPVSELCHFLKRLVWLDDHRVATLCPCSHHLFIHTNGNGNPFPLDLGHYCVALTARSADDKLYFFRFATTTTPRIICCTIDISEWARQHEWRDRFDPSGSETELFYLEGDYGCTACLFVVNNFIVFGLKEVEYQPEFDPYVFNLETNQCQQQLSGFVCLVQASDCPTTFYSLRSEENAHKSVVMWHLCDDGCLRERKTIPVQGQSIEAASTTHVLVWDRDDFLHGGDDTLHAYKITNTGGPCRSFGPCHAAVVSKTRNELLHAQRGRLAMTDAVSKCATIVRAFCLEKPRM